MDKTAKQLHDLMIVRKREQITGKRQQGFPGQHLIVLPDSVRVAALRHPLLRELAVTDAGLFTSAKGHEMERAAGSSTTLLIVCLHGEGWVRIGGRDQTVTADHCVWLPARTPHAYGANAENPWSIVWAHFTGAEVGPWQSFLGVGESGAVKPLVTGGAAQLKLDRVYASLEQGYALFNLIEAAAALRSALAVLAHRGVDSGVGRIAAERVAAARDAMREDPARPRRLEELASAAGLSVPHFSALFHRLTGYAPIDFLIRERVREACRLLDTTLLSIRMIADAVGCQDPYYFTRMFRRIMGCAPRAYRKQLKG